MGHRQKMNREQLLKWDSMQYKARLEAARGNSFQYHSDELEKELERKGYLWHDFNGRLDREATQSITAAKEVVATLRASGHYARIICGLCKDIQGNRYFSVTYKKK